MQNANISVNWLLTGHLSYQMVQMVKIIMQGQNLINNPTDKSW